MKEEAGEIWKEDPFRDRRKISLEEIDKIEPLSDRCIMMITLCKEHEKTVNQEHSTGEVVCVEDARKIIQLRKWIKKG